MRYHLAAALCALGCLAACNTAAPVLPTAAPVLAATSESSATPVIVGTPTVAPTRTPRVLPPTFTPTSDATETPPPTLDVPTRTPFIPQTLPSVCSTFDILPEQSTQTFQIGTSPTITWKQVEGAVRYRVTLGDVNGAIVKDDIFIAETTFTFDPSFFKPNSNLYTWGVYPINQAGDQMCPAVGGEMYPSLTAPQ